MQNKPIYFSDDHVTSVDYLPCNLLAQSEHTPIVVQNSQENRSKSK